MHGLECLIYKKEELKLISNTNLYSQRSTVIIALLIKILDFICPNFFFLYAFHVDFQNLRFIPPKQLLCAHQKKLFIKHAMSNS